MSPKTSVEAAEFLDRAARDHFRESSYALKGKSNWNVATKSSERSAQE